jgi:hypothetical protein
MDTFTITQVSTSGATLRSYREQNWMDGEGDEAFTFETDAFGARTILVRLTRDDVTEKLEVRSLVARNADGSYETSFFRFRDGTEKLVYSERFATEEEALRRGRERCEYIVTDTIYFYDA